MAGSAMPSPSAFSQLPCSASPSPPPDTSPLIKSSTPFDKKPEARGQETASVGRLGEGTNPPKKLETLMSSSNTFALNSNHFSFGYDPASTLLPQSGPFSVLPSASAESDAPLGRNYYDASHSYSLSNSTPSQPIYRTAPFASQSIDAASFPPLAYASSTNGTYGYHTAMSQGYASSATSVNHPTGYGSAYEGLGHGGPAPSSTSFLRAVAEETPQLDRPFKCDQCVQSFNRNHDLKRHKRIHLAVKPFPCGWCTKAFSRKDALKRHLLVKGCAGPGGATVEESVAKANADRKAAQEKREAMAGADSAGSASPEAAGSSYNPSVSEESLAQPMSQYSYTPSNPTVVGSGGAHSRQISPAASVAAGGRYHPYASHSFARQLPGFCPGPGPVPSWSPGYATPSSAAGSAGYSSPSSYSAQPCASVAPSQSDYSPYGSSPDLATPPYYSHASLSGSIRTGGLEEPQDSEVTIRRPW